MCLRVVAFMTNVDDRKTSCAQMAASKKINFVQGVYGIP
jgi:hypothetical protein